MDFNELIKKYNIIFINGNRYYNVDLSKKEYTFENTTPVYIKLLGQEIFESSWKNIIYKIFKVLDSSKTISKKELLDIDVEWGKQRLFNTSNLSNHMEVRDDLYINCNNTAVHAVWTIQLLLKKFEVTDAILVIKRQPIAEPTEVRNYFIDTVKRKFYSYLKYVKRIDDKNINTIINNIVNINKKFLSKFSKGYDDFFLIEEPQTFFNYMKKTTDEIEKAFIYPANVQKAISRQLGYLYDFMRLDKAKRKKTIESEIKAADEPNDFDSSLDKELAELIELDDLM